MALLSQRSRSGCARPDPSRSPRWSARASAPTPASPTSAARTASGPAIPAQNGSSRSSTTWRIRRCGGWPGRTVVIIRPGPRCRTTGIARWSHSSATAGFARWSRRTSTSSTSVLARVPDRVIEIHGTVFAVECLGCGRRSAMREALDRVAAGDPDPACTVCGGILKSATISFGQSLRPEVLAAATDAARRCSLLLAIGSSLQVQPAAGLCEVAKRYGARLVIINADPTPYDGLADAVLRAASARCCRTSWATRPGPRLEGDQRTTSA